ncbi:unnamed protein product [Trifolium pratense]|uniref:Uncharacterized protein n=1 Tax=Trifolium pratense TaxID=57577 RepID=A0ACB0MD11_TRIPR|nr:unnamed protein product [Trifolium pratense]
MPQLGLSSLSNPSSSCLFPPSFLIREDTLFALSSLSEQLLETQESGFRTSNLKNMIEQIVAEDFLIDSLEYPFLYARIFTSVAKFSCDKQ